jgi:hypothetical protein
MYQCVFDPRIVRIPMSPSLPVTLTATSLPSRVEATREITAPTGK